MEAELANRAKKKGKTEEAEKWSKMDGKSKPTSQQANRPTGQQANEAAAEAAEHHRGAQALHQGVYPQGQRVKPDR
jgi:hypothetical protein